MEGVFRTFNTRLVVGIDQFNRDYHNAVRNAGVVLTPDQSRLLGQEVLDNMMLRTALDNLVQKLQLTAGDARVRADIQNNQAFRGPLGLDALGSPEDE